MLGIGHAAGISPQVGPAVEVSSGGSTHGLTGHSNREWTPEAGAGSYSRDMERRLAPRTRDTAVVGAVAAIALVESALSPGLEPRLLATACHLGMAAALWWWARQPLVAGLAVGLFSIVETAGGVPVNEPLTALLALLVVAYGIGSGLSTRSAVPTFVAVVAMEGVAVLLAESTWGNFAFAAAVMSIPFGAGVVLRRRGTEARLLRERAERLEVDRERDAARAAEAERTRIARELHDVISHSVGLMVVQAAAAERVLPTDPVRAALSMRAVQGAGREALTELAGLLGILRHGEEVGLEPQPDLRALEDLADGHRRAGLDVVLDVAPEAVATSRGVQLALYRVAQEALTNVRKHSDSTTASVRVSAGADRVTMVVSDDGPARRHGGPARSLDGGSAGTGFGIQGMRERLRVYGGTVVGAADGAGFTVRASVPLGEPS
jgi:signal transduction histidine kinase